MKVLKLPLDLIYRLLLPFTLFKTQIFPVKLVLLEPFVNDPLK